MVEQLSRASAIYCRDNEAFEYLRAIGVSSPIHEFGPDGCFGIDLRDDARATVYMKEHQLLPNEFITVTTRTNTPAGAKPKIVPKWDIGDRSQNPWDPDETDRQQTQRWAETRREVITHWVRMTKRKVLLAPEVEKEIPHVKVGLAKRQRD